MSILRARQELRHRTLGPGHGSQGLAAAYMTDDPGSHTGQLQSVVVAVRRPLAPQLAGGRGIREIRGTRRSPRGSPGRSGRARGRPPAGRAPTPAEPSSDIADARPERRLSAPRPAIGTRAWPPCELPSVTPAPTRARTPAAMQGNRAPPCCRARRRISDCGHGPMSPASAAPAAPALGARPKPCYRPRQRGRDDAASPPRRTRP